MRINEIIYENEYISSEISALTEFKRISTSQSDLSEEDILIIPNSKSTFNVHFGKSLPLAVICDEKAVLPCNIPRILVKNSRLAVANAFYRFEKINMMGVKIIGVTGTNGKSSTAIIIKRILEYSGMKVGFIGTGKIQIGNTDISESCYSMTTPDPPLLYSSLKKMITDGCEAIVMEVSSHALKLNKVAPLSFDFAIFTNLSPEHCDFHSDMEDYYNTKLSLFKKSKCSIFNLDDPYARKAYFSLSGKRISVGVLHPGDYFVSNLERLGLKGVSYDLAAESRSLKVRLPIPGIYNVYNSMLASVCCIELGCEQKKIEAALKEINAIEGRYEVIKDDITVVIDYAHTSEAFQNIMRELRSVKGSGRLTVLFGCGGERDKSKRPIMAAIAEKYADRIIITSDNSRGEDPLDIINDILSGLRHTEHKVIVNREEAILYAVKQSSSGDTLAIIGKGAERYNIDKDGYHNFDEREIIRSALNKRKRGN